jgi:bacillithiol synthase
MEWIPYRQLPSATGGYSDLFFDFLANDPRVRPFYPRHFLDGNAVPEIIEAHRRRPRDRRTLTRVLREQNARYGGGTRAFANIDALEQENTFVVVTGQQVSLLGGPLYTLLKTLTTIKLAEELQRTHSPFTFVPVFWLEGEDHDFAEMNHCQVFTADNAVARLEYLPGGVMPERNPGPVGEMVFDASIETTLQALAAALQPTEFTPELLNAIRSAYAPGATFNDAFARWLNRMLPDSGVVFLSAHNAELKRLLSPLFLKEIADYPQTSQIVIGQSAELEQVYHAQVKPKSVNLFLFHKGGRYPIEPREADFSLKGTRHFMEPEELKRIAAETPELLSPNVILRPLAQDTLLPTVAYVGGPSEIAYHAQLGPLYGHFGVIQPVLYPRASATVLEERVQRAMEKFGIDPIDLFNDADDLTRKVVAQISEIKLDDLFGRTTQSMRVALNELRFGLGEIDPTLTGALDNAAGKIEGLLTVLSEKSTAAQKRRNETAVRQVERAVGAVIPGGHMQEREISAVYFLNKYGPDFTRWLTGALDISGFQHQLLAR